MNIGPWFGDVRWHSWSARVGFVCAAMMITAGCAEETRNRGGQNSAAGASQAEASLTGKYTATASLQVSPEQDSHAYRSTATHPSRARYEEFEVFKRTQMEMLRTPLILSAALQNEKVRTLRCIKQQRDPVAWLAKQLFIRFPK